MKKRRKRIIVIKSVSEIPKKFKSEGAERRFWETHGLSLALCEKFYDPKVNKEFSKIQKRLRMTDRRK